MNRPFYVGRMLLYPATRKSLALFTRKASDVCRISHVIITDVHSDDDS
jgi:hypothetical protein